MQEDNYTFRDTDSPTVWTIHFAGAHLKDIKVVVAIGNGPDTTLVVFATLVEKRRMPATADFMRNLLEQNHKLERVKIGLDKDGESRAPTADDDEGFWLLFKSPQIVVNNCVFSTWER